MAKIRLSSSGDFSKTFQFLDHIRKRRYIKDLNKYGRMGVDALRDATPKLTGKTAESWSYEVRVFDSYAEIVWSNSNVNKGRNIAVLLQYGHGLPQGGYVQGIDYINPAMKSVFEKLAKEAWVEVIAK